ncbi:NAD-dependent epimerase/dehydratase family protein [Sphingomonas sp. 179-A 2A2 NHS]|uniref:NAD-dependent epimerase/dehydratase family protein n=1 Tax=Sphingomonas sp. 179-A 2A2 NHS TaxID=3374290 RepID=UPI00387A1AE2
MVLGAGGFIGTNLCLALRQSGSKVTAVGHRPADWPAMLADVAWVEADFNDASAMARVVARGDTVVHLLGGSAPAESNANPIRDVEDSLLPSLRLIDICAAAGVGRLIFLSSGGTVYGPSDRQRLSESDSTNPISAYGINKLAVEKYLGLFRHLHGLSAIALRVANPYGPFHRRVAQGIVGAALYKALAGKPIEIWGDGSVVRDYLHVDDLVAAILLAADYQGSDWVFNIGSGQGRSIREVVVDVCAQTDTPLANVVYLPGRLADVPRNVLDCGLAARELGWRPRIAWSDGLRATAEWMQDKASYAEDRTAGR